MLGNWLAELLPERLVKIIIKKAKCDESLPLNQLSRETREKLIESITSLPLNVSKAVGYSKAEVTAGGIDLSEVDPKSLESKLQPGLFFAGEILDVDGRIGGFNFQWAWASGFVSASHAAACTKGSVINAS